MRTATLATTLALALATTAVAAPRGPGARGPGMGPGGGPGAMHGPEDRERMMRRVHTMLVVELGEILELDTAGTIKLSEKLEPFHDQRVKLQLENFESMQQLRRLADGKEAGDAAAVVKRIAANRVRLAEIDQRELDAIVGGLPPDKAAKVALFATQFPKRIEKMAHRARRKGPPPAQDADD